MLQRPREALLKNVSELVTFSISLCSPINRDVLALTIECVGNRSVDRGYIRTVFVPLLRRMVDIMVAHGASIEWCGTRASMLPLLPQLCIARACIRSIVCRAGQRKNFSRKNMCVRAHNACCSTCPHGYNVKRSWVLCCCAACDHMGSASKQFLWHF